VAFCQKCEPEGTHWHPGQPPAQRWRALCAQAEKPPLDVDAMTAAAEKLEAERRAREMDPQVQARLLAEARSAAAGGGGGGRQPPAMAEEALRDAKWHALQAKAHGEVITAFKAALTEMGLTLSPPHLDAEGQASMRQTATRLKAALCGEGA
jgi:hypothetical protein